MQASSPTDAGQGSAGLCRISPPPSGNAPLRLRLAAHPPPLAGEAFGGLPPGRLPCKGLRSRAPPAADTARRSRCGGRRMQARFSVRRMMRVPQTGNVGVSRLRGAAHDLANILPGCRKAPPAGVLARRCTPTGPPTKKHRGAALRRPGAKRGKKEKGVNRWCNTAPGRATACGTGRPRRPPARRGCRSGRWRPGQTRRSRRRTCSWTAGG